jgi:CRP-like cAMP-binding protein
MVDTSVLASLPVFETLDEFDREKVAKWFEARDVSDGTELIGEGAPGYSFFVLCAGNCEVRSGDVAIGELGPGDFFGEGAILGDGRRHASIVTTSPAKVLVMFGTEFRRLEQTYPQIAGQIKSAAANRLAAGER